MTGKPCKDCTAAGIPPNRPAIYPGPRCATHHRHAKKRARAEAHARRINATYGITADTYWQIYEAQGRHCAICERATGTSRRLAVDHDHRNGCDHPAAIGCPNCVRGLLCGPCNELIGRYPAEALQRAIDYLNDPPAQRGLP